MKEVRIMGNDLTKGAQRVVADLQELADLSSNEQGAQRVAWTPTWQKARDWFADKAREAGAEVTVDTAGNSWAKIAGESTDAVAIGSHLDCVPNGGWLDGALGTVVTLEVLRRYGKGSIPKKTIYGVTGVERHYIDFKGQAAHAGSFPTLMRQDAFLAAAQASLAFKEIALKYDGVCTVGKVSVTPDVVTIVPETCRISLDQRSIDQAVLKSMNDDARAVSAKAASDQSVVVNWEKIWTIAPTMFDARLTELCKQAVEEETG